MKCSDEKCDNEIFEMARPYCEICTEWRESTKQDALYIEGLQTALISNGINPFSRTFRETYLKKLNNI